MDISQGLHVRPRLNDEPDLKLPLEVWSLMLAFGLAKHVSISAFLKV